MFKAGKKRDVSGSTVLQVMLFAGVLRIILGITLGAWIDGRDAWDSAMMVNYANLVDHFTNPWTASVVKYIGYPFFLWVTHFFRFIPYTAWISMLWLAAGILAFFLCRKIGMTRKFALAAFVYFSFIPEAFCVDAGTRIYRNSIIGPFSLFSFLWMIYLGLAIREYDNRKKNCVIIAVFTGLFVVFTAYIKEDGIWIIACLLFATLLYAVEVLWRMRKKKAGKKSVWVCVFLPLICVLAVSFCYKSVNYKFFGVFETNTRTGGQTGKFIENVYRIASDERNSSIWAPVDAIEKAFAASPTLSEEPEFLEAIKTSVWLRGDIYENPILGDFLGWVIMTEYENVFGWQGEAKKEAFFKQVNRELKTAFQEGRLEREKGRIMLLPSAGSKNIEEILHMKEQIGLSYRCAIWLYQYEAGIRDTEPELIEDAQSSRANWNATVFTNLSYLWDYSGIMKISQKSAKVCDVIFVLYRIWNSVLLGILVWNLFRMAAVRFLGKKKTSPRSVLCTFGVLLFLGISLAYTFGIAWFSSFLHSPEVNVYWINYYVTALPVILGIAYWLSLISVFSEVE